MTPERNSWPFNVLFNTQSRLTAWRLRRLRPQAGQPSLEPEFLPAAWSLHETPPHPTPRLGAWLLMGLVATAFAWSYLGRVDVVAIAPGRIVPSLRSKTIQPLEAGLIRRILVKDGSHVQTGDTLIELDATAAQADHSTAQEERDALLDESHRASALLQALSLNGSAGQLPAQLATRNMPSESHHRLQTEWRDLRARLAQWDSEMARLQAEIRAHEQALLKLKTLLPLARQREQDIQLLQTQGFVGGHASQDKIRERVELEGDLATQAARLQVAKAALKEGQQTRAAWLAESKHSLSERAAAAQLKAQAMQQEAIKARQRQALSVLKAPVNGIVQQLAVHTEGGVVTEGQPLMIIVPDDEQISAEVLIDNKDIGFVHAGQIAQVKLETFNFTRYGTVAAAVERVGSDAVADERRGLVFPATIALTQRQLMVDGRTQALTPGMSLTAEILIGQRRVIDFLLTPLQTTAQTSLKER